MALRMFLLFSAKWGNNFVELSDASLHTTGFQLNISPGSTTILLAVTTLMKPALEKEEEKNK